MILTLTRLFSNQLKQLWTKSVPNEQKNNGALFLEVALLFFANFELSFACKPSRQKWKPMVNFFKRMDLYLKSILYLYIPSFSATHRYIQKSRVDNSLPAFFFFSRSHLPTKVTIPVTSNI